MSTKMEERGEIFQGTDGKWYQRIKYNYPGLDGWRGYLWTEVDPFIARIKQIRREHGITDL